MAARIRALRLPLLREEKMKSLPYGCLIALAAILAVVAPAHAQYPTKPIRLIVPVAAGGPADMVARIIGQSLSASLGKQVVVDNRAGAGGNIAAEMAAKAPADGHTVLWSFTSHAINVSLYPQSGFNLTRDFAAISLIVSSPYALVVHPSLPVTSLKDLIALAKARPNQLDYAYSGNHPLLATALLLDMAGIKMNQIPYKGAPAALTALIGGEVSFAITGLVGIIPHVKSGKLRALAVTTTQRSPVAPELPTVSEAGVKDYEVVAWFGMSAPAGTPNAIISRLHDESVKALKQPDVRGQFSAAGMEPIGSTPEEFGAYIRSEIDKWARMVKISGARPD